MKKIFSILFLFVAMISFAQSIHAPLQIGASNRNQSVARGFWVKTDTALFSSKIWIPADASTGYVFTSDANGFGTWQPATGGGWSLTGNSGTTSSNFIGTTDSKILHFGAKDSSTMLLDTATGCLVLYKDETLVNTLRGYGFMNANRLYIPFVNSANQLTQFAVGDNNAINVSVIDTGGLGNTGYGISLYGGNGFEAGASFASSKGRTRFMNGLYSFYGNYWNTENSIYDIPLDYDVASFQGFRPNMNPFYTWKMWDSIDSSFIILRYENIGHNFRCYLETGATNDTISFKAHNEIGLSITDASTIVDGNFYAKRVYAPAFQLASADTGAGKVLVSDASGNASWDTTSFTPLDSVSIYAIAPTNGTTYFCTDCSGDGVLGRIVSYFGAAWRRLKFD